MLASVVSYEDRGTGGKSSYRGNCSPRLVKDILDHFKPKQVVDPFGGSYTTRDVCAERDVPCWSSDLRDGFNVLSGEIPVGADLAFLHPPYHHAIYYSGQVWGNKADPSDLSRCPDYQTFVNRLNEAQMRVYESLRRGGVLAVLVGDVKKNGELFPIQRDMAWIGQPINEVIKLQHNCWSNSVKYHGNFIPILHEYLVLTKKPDCWYVTVRETSQRTVNLKKSRKMTWRSVVQSALDALDGKSSLDDIYDALKDHVKVTTSENNFWKEKVRQTLQRYFVHGERGVWSLAA